MLQQEENLNLLFFLLFHSPSQLGLERIGSKIHIHEGTWESNICLGDQPALKPIGNQWQLGIQCNFWVWTNI